MTIPPAKSGLLRIVAAVFLLAWLGAWAMGGWSSVRELLKPGPGLFRGFLIFWLCGWSVGGVMVMLMVYGVLRPGQPEVLVLTLPGLKYDTGWRPFPPRFDRETRQDLKLAGNAWRRLIAKRRQVEFSAQEVATLRLREFAEGNRLTMDHGGQRYELGKELGEPEREWLYRVLCAGYGLAPKGGSDHG